MRLNGSKSIFDPKREKMPTGQAQTVDFSEAKVYTVWHMAMTGSTTVCLPQRSGPLAVRPLQNPMEAVPEPSGAEPDAV